MTSLPYPADQLSSNFPAKSKEQPDQRTSIHSIGIRVREWRWAGHRVIDMLHRSGTAISSYLGLNPAGHSSARILDPERRHPSIQVACCRCCLFVAQYNVVEIQSVHFISCIVYNSHQSPISNNHLRHTLSSERLAANEILMFQACQSVEACCQEKDDSCSDQAAGMSGNKAEPLNHRHDRVYGCSHVIRRDLSDE